MIVFACAVGAVVYVAGAVIVFVIGVAYPPRDSLVKSLTWALTWPVSLPVKTVVNLAKAWLFR